ncbi:hypothetical protein [Pseudoponticoccus marisrubri]|uniref:Uncharacterized protein n=1 Tax=Pseudoponticoccus marisrubri TaxID=1685382 RepID=A0A0W7WPY6_9RHOB|nr:hypothetical protein [Pseudoponticoccus marisrubri]KUF12583.1 hypothetical protein AVJ23_02320 [Pseudoponticoccus marisrubri]
MSRRDERKALTIRLPSTLRRALVRTTEARLSLAYLSRHALRQAFERGLAPDPPVEPGLSRPILLQLSPDERARLRMLAERHGLSEEVTVLSLIAAVV